MINTNEYITILFGLFAALLGIYVTIYLQKVESSKKRKATIIVTVTAILLIQILTIIYGYGKFDFSKLLPFGKHQFTDAQFKEKYKKYSECLFCIFFSYYFVIFSHCGNIKDNFFNYVVLDKRYAIITILFHFPISVYAHIWFIYMLCYYSFSLKACILISFMLYIIEFLILYFINKHLTFKKLRKIGFFSSKSSDT